MAADPDTALRAAVDRFQQGDLPAAKAACETVLKHAPHNPLALNLMALIARAAKKWGKAEEIAAAGFKTNPEYPDLANTRGLVLLDQRRWEDAAAAFQQALDLDPASPLYLGNLARAEMGRGDVLAAEAAFDKALAQDSTYSAALTGRASLLIQTGRLEDAERDLAIASASAPDSPEVLAGRAVLDLAKGDLDSAYALFDQVSAVSPDMADAAVNRGLIRLLQGHISDGWEDYAQRRRRRWARSFGRHSDIPPWDGAGLGGKSLLVWSEQGLGEAVLGASQLQTVIDEAEDVSVEANERLTTLFSRSFPNAEVVPQTDPPDRRIAPDRFEFQTSLFDLIGHRAQDIAHRGPRSPYLKADSSQAENLRHAYRRELNADLLVGLSWESPQALTAGQKGVPVEAWKPVLSQAGVGFVNVQYGPGRLALDDTARALSAPWLTDPAIDPGGDLDPFAAQLAALDLVITVSNTTAHLAAALGTETWVLVPPLGTASMWYWFTDRTDSPWYSAARLYRRRHGQDQDLLERVAAELAQRT